MFIPRKGATGTALLTRWILALNVHTLEGGYLEGATDTMDTGTLCSHLERGLLGMGY